MARPPRRLAEDAQLRVRPSPSVWSPLEYAGHVRDVLTLFTNQAEHALVGDNPTFAYQNQEASIAAADQRRSTEGTGW
jgi:hypothetical protein